MIYDMTAWSCWFCLQTSWCCCENWYVIGQHREGEQAELLWCFYWCVHCIVWCGVQFLLILCLCIMQ